MNNTENVGEGVEECDRAETNLRMNRVLIPSI